MKKVFLVMAFAVCFFLVTQGIVSADPNEVVTNPSTRALTVATPEVELAPLTELERAAAKPMPLKNFEPPAYPEELKKALRPSLEAKPKGKPVIFPSKKGPKEVKVSKGTVESGDLEAADDQASTLEGVSEESSVVTQQDVILQSFPPYAYEYPFPFTRLEVFQVNTRSGYTTFPYRTIGPLYFTIPGEGNFRCTASVAQGRWVWTTGHCVVSPSNNWHTNFTFTPGYYNGKAPYGVWSWDGMAASLTGWSAYGIICYDIGAVRFQRNSKNKTLAQVVGSLGFMANAWEQQHWNEFGYPAGAPFTGTRLIQSQSSIAEVDIFAILTGGCGIDDPLPNGVGNDMTGGSSGGPWIVSFSGSGGETNYVNGLNSYKYLGYDLSIYGPYFGEGALNIWNFMKAYP